MNVSQLHSLSQETKYAKFLSQKNMLVINKNDLHDCETSKAHHVVGDL